MYGRILVLLIVAAFSVGRFYITPEPMTGPAVFKDFAHIVWGLLLGGTIFASGRRWFYGSLMAAFTLVEIVAFGISHRQLLPF
jgi:hypothetical protein